MSCAYQYGVETTPQPAAIPNVSAPEAICSRPRYGVTKTSVAASRSAISSIARKRSSNSTWSSRPRSSHCLLERQPIPLSLAARDVRMCPPGDHVEHLRMTLDDRRQRLDHRLDPLAGGDQPERREQEPLAAAVRRAHRGAVAAGALQRVGVCALREHRRRAVRHDANLVGGARPARDQQPFGRLGHHDHELGLAAQRGEHVGLVLRRLRQHGVERHDERLRQLLRERDHVRAVGAAEDPVLVLEEDDVDVQPAENPRRADVVAANRLGDRRHEPGPLGTGRLVDDDDLLDSVDPVDAEERATHVGRKGADAASARRIG